MRLLRAALVTLFVVGTDVLTVPPVAARSITDQDRIDPLQSEVSEQRIIGMQVLRNFEPFDSEANEISENNSEEPRSNRTVERINLTLPGTKWCGPGNTADDYEDLGKHEEEDKCCRDHDHCDNIPAGEMKYGLTNDDYFTRLHCKCDRDFQQCLKKINTTLSNRLGSFYFAVRDKCYKKQYPIVDCGEKKNM
ncbi:hypothetical protein pipiens_010501 [Culex pipiens pipiens]|uniref:Phospholipase A2 n=1 Tax=Culex pipiens pipiens TaxID=38569 RepID=A0ABD1DD89_CULPP